MTAAPLRLLIHGASGRMGRALLRLAAADPRLRVVAAVSRSGTSAASDGSVMVLAASGIDRCPDFDVAIDFSLPEALPPLLALCRARGAALVSGTTGFSEAQARALQAAGDDIALVWASNFSLGVVLLEELVARAARALPGWPVDIVEVHHTHKKDAPSGTALSLARASATGGGTLPPIESIREGEVVGEHRVRFTGAGETLEFAHRALDRDIFARGALEAALKLAGKPAGSHSLGALLFDA